MADATDEKPKTEGQADQKASERAALLAANGEATA